MIVYNIGYREPYRYDKFALNILNLCNEINRKNTELDNTLNKKSGKLYDIEYQIDNLTSSCEDTMAKLHELIMAR